MNVMNLLAQARPASLDPQPVPARRASDLAAAITASRYDQRPGNGTDSRRRGARPPRPGRRIAAGAGAAALAGAAAAAVALTYVGAPAAAAHHREVASAGKAWPGTSGSLRTAILTAFNAASGDILYSRTTESSPHGRSVTDQWSYPAQPSVGQQVRTRIELVYASNTAGLDMEFIYRQPAGLQGTIRIGSAHTEQIEVEYGNRTWSDQIIDYKGVVIHQNLREAVARGEYAAAAKTELNGRAAIKLTVGQGAADTLWIDAVTYLPLREVSESGGYTYEVDCAYLPPTAANLAKLNVAIPAGFKRTPTIEPPKRLTEPTQQNLAGRPFKG